jgi:L-asparaginase II
MAAAAVAVEVWRDERLDSQHQVRASVADPDVAPQMAGNEAGEPDRAAIGVIGQFRHVTRRLSP